MFRHAEDSVLTTDDVPQFQCKPSTCSSKEAQGHPENVLGSTQD